VNWGNPSGNRPDGRYCRGELTLTFGGLGCRDSWLVRVMVRGSPGTRPARKSLSPSGCPTGSGRAGFGDVTGFRSGLALARSAFVGAVDQAGIVALRRSRPLRRAKSSRRCRSGSPSTNHVSRHTGRCRSHGSRRPRLVQRYLTHWAGRQPLCESRKSSGAVARHEYVMDVPLLSSYLNSRLPSDGTISVRESTRNRELWGNSGPPAAGVIGGAVTVRAL
jgi:hypothetical protein